MLSCGLPSQSRTMRRVSGQKLTMQEMLLAAICDNLSCLVWLNTRDGVKGRNRPKPILPELMGTNKEDTPVAYPDGAAFMAAWNELLGGDMHGD